jgi:hypothetical protein
MALPCFLSKILEEWSRPKLNGMGERCNKGCCWFPIQLPLQGQWTQMLGMLAALSLRLGLGQTGLFPLPSNSIFI